MILQETVQAIKNLPFEEFQNLLYVDDDLGTSIKILKYQYHQHGRWLDYYLLNHQELCLDLRKNNVALYKPLGERTNNIYQHLKQIKSLPSVFDSIDINDFLYLLEREIFQKILNESGIYNTLVIKGKRTTYEETKEQALKFQDVDRIKLLGSNHTTSPWQLMISESITIAKSPENIQFKELHRQFLNQLTRCDRLMYKSSLQAAYMKNGKLIVGGDGKRAGK